MDDTDVCLFGGDHGDVSSVFIVGAVMGEFMTSVMIPIPQTLYDRIALRAEEVGMTTEQLAGVWLWKADYEERMGRKFGRPETRTEASRDDEDLSAGKANGQT